MSSVDNRVVEMQFNNKRFEENARETMSTLDKLKEKLSFKSSTKEMQEFQNTADSFNLSRIANAVEDIGDKFTLMGHLGQQALERIASAALNAGTALVKSISIDQISAGMTKYEQETNVIQTLYGALKPKGTQLSEIYDVMATLTAYSDETSYGYTQMADAVSKFVNAGVDLKKAETVIEGISNAAALAGIGIHETDIIYRNFADAISKGGFRAQDWKSIQLGHMDTEWLKQAFIDEAIARGKLDASGRVQTKAEKRNKKGQITQAAEYKNVKDDFEGTLRKGWLDTDVINAVMIKYATRDLKGFGKEAFAAAQNAKTFTDVLDAVKDSVSTGWSTSFRIIFGDLEEAIAFFTPMANTVIEFTSSIDEARNQMLTQWKKLGGRDSMIGTLETLWGVLLKLEAAFNGAFFTAFHNSFYPLWKDMEESETTGGLFNLMGEQLFKLTKQIESAAEAFKNFLSGRFISDGFYAIFSVINMIRLGINGVFTFFGEIFRQLEPTFKAIGEFFGEISQDIGKLNKHLAINGGFEALAKSLAAMFEPLTKRLPKVINWLQTMYQRLKKMWTSNPRFVTFRKTLTRVFTMFIRFVPKAIESLIQFGKGIIDTVKNSDEWKALLENYNKYVKPVINFLERLALRFNKVLGDFFAIDTSSEGTMWDKLKKRFSAFDKLGPWLQQQWDELKKKLPWLQNVEDWWNSSPFITEMKEWFGAIGTAIDTFFSADTSDETSLVGKLKKRFAAMWDSFGPWLEGKWAEYKEKWPILQQIEDLLGNLFGWGKEAETEANEAEQSTNTVTTALQNVWNKITEFVGKIDFGKLVGFAVGIGLLIKFYQWVKTITSFAGIGEAISDAIGEIGDFFRTARKALKKSNMLANVTAILEVAGSIWLLGDTLAKVSQLSWEEIAKGLAAMAGLFVEEGAFMIVMSKFNTGPGKVKPLQILAIAGSMWILGKVLKDVASLSWEEIGKGLTAMGGLFIEEGAFMILVNRFGSPGLFKRKGTSATSMIGLAVSMLLLGYALKNVATLTWEEIGRGLTAMGGLFALEGAFMILVNRFGSVNFWKKKGASATSMISLAKNLEMLAGTLKDLADMTWEEIGRGLTAMGGLFALEGAFMILVNRLSGGTKAVGISSTIGTAGSIYILAGKLKDLATMSWEEIGRGLTAMAGLFVEEGAFMVIIGLLSKKDLIKPDAVNVTTGVLAGGVGMMGDAMAKLGQLSWDEILKGGVALAAIEVVLGIFVALMSKVEKIKITNGIGMVAMAAAALVMVQAFMPLTTIDWEGLKVGIVSLAAIAAILGVFCYAMGKIDASVKSTLTVIVSAIALAALMVAFAFALTLIKDVDTSLVLAFGAAMLLVTGAMVALSIALGVFSNMSLGAAIKATAIMIVAAAGLAVAVGLILLIVGQAIQDFSNNIAVVGANLAQYSDMVKDIDMEVINNSVTMLKTLAEAFVEIGGKEYGELASFKDNLTLMGASLKLFYLEVEPVDTDMVTTIKGLLVDLANSFAEIGGKEYGDLDTFRSSMTRTGSGLKLFYLQVAQVDTDRITTIKGLLIDLSNAFTDIGEKEYGNTEIFRTYLSRMGSSVKLFQSNTADADLERMKSVTEALKTMAIDLSGFPEVQDVGTSIGHIAGAINLYSESLKDTDLSKAPDTTAIKTVFDTLKEALPDDDEALTEVAGYASGDKGTQMTNFAIGLTNIATAVSTFAANVKDADFDQVDKAVSALQAISKLNTNLQTGMASQFEPVAGEVKTQSQGLDTFATDLTTLGTAVATFGTSVKDTSFEQVDKAINALNAIEKLNNNLKTEISTQFGPVAAEAKTQAVGLDTFAADLTTLGTAVSDFGTSVKDTNFEQVDKAVEALEAIKNLNDNLDSSTIVKIGPFAIELASQKAQMGTTFSQNIIALGAAMNDFGTNISKVNKDDLTTGTEVLGKIVELNDALPKTGGISSWITGTQSLTNFAANLKLLGAGAKDFGDAVKGSNFDAASVTAAGDALIKIAEVNGKLPKTGGISSWFTGDQSLGNFSSGLKELGKGVKEFAESFGETKITDEIVKAVNFINRIANIQVKLGNATDWYSMDSFGSELNTAAGYFVELNNKLKGVTELANLEPFENLLSFAVEQQTKLGDTQYTKNLKDIGTQVRDFFNEIWSFTSTWTGGNNGKLEQVTRSVTSIFNTLNKAFVNAEPEVKFNGTGESILTFLMNGFTDENSMIKVEKAVNDICGKIIIKVKSYTGKGQAFYNVGTWIPAGLADGIYAGQSSVVNAIIDVCNAGVEAGEQTLGIASPSKEFARLGMYSDMGLAQGFHNYLHLVDSAANDVSQSAIGTILKDMQDIQNLPLDEMDIRPTIRPVLDTSNIASRAGMIDGLLGGNRNIGLNTRQIEAQAQLISDASAADLGTISQEVANLNTQLAQMQDIVANLRVVLNNGVLVGQLMPDIDKAMGARGRMAERGS